jgi:phi13 family phage major tail protein
MDIHIFRRLIMANKNKVQFGLSQLAIAELEPDSGSGVPSWKTPIMWPGAVNLSMNAETQEEKFYADDGLYYGEYIDDGYTGELEIAMMLEAFAVMALGWYVDGRGGLVEQSNGMKSNFALLGQFKGDKHGARWAIYNVSAGKPSAEASTRTPGSAPQTQKIPYTATPIQIADGIYATKYTLFDDSSNETVHTAYTDWFKQVTLPIPVEAQE